MSNPQPQALKKFYQEHPGAYSDHAKIGMNNPERIDLQRKIGRMVFSRKEFQKDSLAKRSKNPVMKA